ncbi:biosynthetic peptidoglycan transglycosylase [Pyxidicoccus sp. MSG2]|uniref:biosynthetic peptidoglycan transglycosylase n=1 Tax=Pyxidicoccus sp. MSG2 TaxID=2996790 RepID=UPI0022700B47|nr:biosynthetic peptidoglycan transglycosylase [Pyxidicoccus sp. MSG2]MCY1019671.1 transglycosylase domain-containing protein [Pyxidicoccus sp. MSG2]
MRRRTKAGLLLLGAPLLYAAALWLSVPDVSPLERETPERTSLMRLRAREQERPDDGPALRQTSLEGVSTLLACAVVKAEDRGFFRHAGVEWRVVREVAAGWLRGQTRRGGSTLTQQLARNLYLTPSRTPHRKLRELLIARELEAHLDKRRILELYLSTAEWGDGVWGAADASQRYFSKAPDTLDAFEASFLASLLPSPREPLTGGNAERARRAQLRVLSQLHRSGLLEAPELQRDLLRVRALHARLARGESPGEALAALRAPTEGPSTLPRHDYPLEAMLRDECGLAREVAEERAAWENSRHDG